MIFSYLFLLPQVLAVGQDLAACLDGDLTEEDTNKLIDDLFVLLKNIPALQGFMGIFETLVKVAKAVVPLIENSPKAKMARAKLGATDHDVKVANMAIKIYDGLTIKMAQEKNQVIARIPADDVWEKMTANLGS